MSNQDSHLNGYSSEEYQQLHQLTNEEIIKLKQILINKRSQNQKKSQNPVVPKQPTNPNTYHKELALLSDYYNKDKHRKIKILSQNTQNQPYSQQVVRKSRRIRDKEKRKQYSSQPPKNYTSMIKKIEKQHRSQETKQFNRLLIQRLKNPGKPTLRQTKIMFKNNQFFYSISIRQHQFCTKHKIDKKGLQYSLSSNNQHFMNQTLTCNYCKKYGTYWFSSNQLLKINNGNFIRKYLETFI